MNLRALFTLHAVVAFGYSIPLTVLTNWFLPLYGVDVTPGAVQLSRFFGAALVGYGALVLQARTLPQGAAGTRAIVNALAITNVVGLIVSIVGRLQGIGNAMGWTTVVVYVFFAGAYTAFALRKRDADKAVAPG